MGGKEAALAKLSAAGVSTTASAVFSDYYDELAEQRTGMIPESTIVPFTDPHQFVSDASAAADSATGDDIAALDRTVIIRLNGGLATSMGMVGTKALLPVRDGLSFLDIIVRQIIAARARYGVRLPLLLFNSFYTSDETRATLRGYPDLVVPGVPQELLQSIEPKLLLDTLAPVDWPADPALEWCPPGHGDIYPTLYESGVLDVLIAAGYRYASISNSDNLGAVPDARLAGWFAASGAPFAMEVTRRTPMDIKGGHLARQRCDGRLVLRESAQTPPEDQDAFAAVAVHPFMNTNNLWFDLVALHDQLAATQGRLHLPLIRNLKTVDPNDAASPRVIHIESAMGAAVEVFDGAVAVEIPRDRFIPVKTCNELALLRSDVFEFDEYWTPRATIDRLPVIALGSDYQRIADFERLIPFPLRLRDAVALRVQGAWGFGRDVSVTGTVELDAAGGSIPNGTQLRG